MYNSLNIIIAVFLYYIFVFILHENSICFYQSERHFNNVYIDYICEFSLISDDNMSVAHTL